MKYKKLGDVTDFISKGIPPKYAEGPSENTVRVLNQKCNRNGEISLKESRWNDLSLKKVSSEKFLKENDVLINSTGQGTAGRVAQISKLDEPMIVDSHMIIMRSSSEVDPIYYGYAVKAQQHLIERFAEGSTGQTEINRDRLLNEINIKIPSKIEQKNIAKKLFMIDRKIKVNRVINANLVA